jgi:hypothetical protein
VPSSSNNLVVGKSNSRTNLNGPFVDRVIEQGQFMTEMPIFKRLRKTNEGDQVPKGVLTKNSNPYFHQIRLNGKDEAARKRLSNGSPLKSSTLMDSPL